MVRFSPHETTDGKTSTGAMNKFRKSTVEKIRRDRLNTSIEKLKTALRKQIAEKQPRMKLEKAEILEMTVNFLKKSTKGSVGGGYRQGFTQCLQETLRFISSHSPMQSADREAFESFYVIQRTELQKNVLAEQQAKSLQVHLQSLQSTRRSLWRPW